MENTRLLQLLHTLTPQERLELRKFVESPFFNQRKEAVRLLDILLKWLNKGKEVSDKEAVFEAVFEGQSFDDHRLRMAVSFLYALVRRYLTVKDFMDSPLSYSIRESEVLRRRKLYALSRKSLEAAQEHQAGRSIQNADFFDEEYRFLLEKCRLDMSEPGAPPEHLQQLSDQLDRAFLSRKLWQNCVMLSHQTVANARFSPGILDQAIEGIEDQSILETPAIAIYYHYYRALTRPDQLAYYFNFKNLLFQHGATFPVEELRDLYLLAINFCIRQYNAGNQTFLREQFDFYQEGLERQYFLVAGELSVYTYMNAVTLALVLQELEWAGRFIQEYKPMLPSGQQESLFSFNRARLEYAAGQYGKALQLLQKVDFKEVHIALAAKTLQLKIYYTLGELDLLDAHLQALKAFLHRKKVMGYHKENYTNTIRFTHKLLETPLYNKVARAALRQEIEQTGAVAEKEWLLAQL